MTGGTDAMRDLFLAVVDCVIVSVVIWEANLIITHFV